MSEVHVSFCSSLQSSHNSAGKALPDSLPRSVLAFSIYQSVMVSGMWLSTNHKYGLCKEELNYI